MIGFFGDSFFDLNPSDLHDREKGILPWPLWVAEKLKMKSIVHARSGSAVWYAYERFLENFDKCDIVIFGYTDYSRTNGLDEQHAGLGIVRTKHDPFIQPSDFDVANAVAEYKKYLYNEELQKFIMRKVFEEVNNLCYEHNKKLVNVLSFESPDRCILDVSKAKYPCLTNLFDVSANEPIAALKLVPDLRHCHLSPENNIVLADITIETIGKESTYTKDLTLDNRFTYV